MLILYLLITTIYTISCKSIINKIKTIEKRNIDRKHLDNNVEFEDFKAKKPYKERLLGCILMQYKITRQSPTFHNGLYYFKWNVNLTLIKSKSYLKDKEDTSVYIHEVIHYKLYQIMAERIRNKLNSTGFKDSHNVDYYHLVKPLFMENNYINKKFDKGDTLINGININRLRTEIINELYKK